MLVLFALLLCLTCICNCEAQYDLAGILQHSADAIGSNDLQKNDEVLRKFYFSHEKDSSIWVHIIKENVKWFKRSLTRDDLINIGKDLQSLYRHYDRCWSMDSGLSQTFCYKDLLHVLKGAERDTAWLHLVGDTEEDARGKYGLTFAGFSVMSAHLSLIAANSTQNIEDVKKMKVIKKGFKSLLDKFVSRFVRYEEEITKWRLDLITAVKICEIKQHFWEDFEKSCEIRWKRDIEDNEESASAATGSSGVGNITQIRSYVKKSDKSGSALEFHNNDASLDIADQIGTSIKLKKKRFHATVMDLVTEEAVFEKYLDAKTDSIGKVIQKLFKRGLKKRSKKVKKLKEDLDQFNNATITQVREVLSKCITRLDY